MIPRLAYVLVAVVLIGDIPSMFRRRAEARVSDRGSYYLIVATLGSSYWLAFVLPQWAPEHAAAAWRAGALGDWAAPAAALLGVGGVALRLWAIRTLGRYFTRVVHVSGDQPVIEAGPYRWVRHPSYTGAGLSALGVGLALNNAWCVALLALAYAACMSYRIHIEEAALTETVGRPYRDYMARTKRLIPFVY